MKKTCFLFICMLFFLHSIWGQEKSPPKKNSTNILKTHPKTNSPLKTNSPNIKILERNFIYIPYKNFSQTLQNQTKGVFIPFPFFQELLAFQTTRQTSIVPSTLKVPFALLESSYQGKIEGKALFVKMNLSFQVFKKGWVKIPLRLLEASLTSFTLKAPHFLTGGARGYSLYVKGPGKWKSHGSFLYKIEKKEKFRSIYFRGPLCAKGTFQISLLGKENQFTIQKSLFVQPSIQKNQTKLAIFLGSQGEFLLTWKEKAKVIAPKKSQIEGLSIVQSTYSLEGEKHKITVRFKIFGGKTNHFKLKFPAGYEYSFLKGNYLSLVPDPEKDGKGKKLEIRLNRLVSKQYIFQFQLEKPYFNFPAKVSPPTIQISGARQERGYFTLYSEGEASATPLIYKGYTRTSFQPIQNLVFPSSPYVFFYSRKEKGKPIAPITYKLTKKKPEIEPKIGILVHLEENQIRVHSKIFLKIRKAKLLSFQIQIPSGYSDPQLLSGNGRIEKLKEDLKKGTIKYEIILNKSEKKSAFVELSYYGNFLGLPSSKKKSKIQKKTFFPWILVVNGRNPKGFLAISARSKYKMEITQATSLLRDTPSFEERSWIPRATSKGVIYAIYRILKFPYFCQGYLKLKKPKIFVSTKGQIILKENLFQIKTFLDYQIYHAGITEISFKLPFGYTSKNVRIEGNFIANTILGTKKNNLWKVRFQKEILGNYQLRIFYEKELKALPLGKLTDLPPFSIFLKEGKRKPSFLSVSKKGNVNFYFVEKNLKEVDISQLPYSLKSAKPFKGYEILNGKFSLQIKAMKLQYSPVVNSVVEHFHLDSVVNRDGSIQNQFYFVLKNNGRQYLNLQFPKGFQSLLLEVEGEPVLQPPQGKNKEEILVNLLNIPSSSGGNRQLGKSISIRGRYVLMEKKLGMGGIKSLKPLILSVPVTLFTWKLYLPHKYSYLKFSEDYIHKKNTLPFFSYFQRILEGSFSYVTNYDQKVYQLERTFNSNSSFFQKIAIQGKSYSFYLPGTMASQGSKIPSLRIIYLEKKLTTFLELLMIVLTFFAFFLIDRFFKFRKIILVTLGIFFLLLVSLILSPTYQSFIFFSFLTMLGYGCFWFGESCLQALNQGKKKEYKKEEKTPSGTEDSSKKNEEEK